MLDFGLAKIVEDPSGPSGASPSEAPTMTGDLTGMGRILGTTAYMSPEQARGEALDHQSDIFSLGVMLFEMATGQRPFQGESAIELLSSVIKDQAPLVSDIKPQLPPGVGRVIGRCLEKSPAQRYSGAEELHGELQELRQESLSGPAAPARQAPAGTRIHRFTHSPDAFTGFTGSDQRKY